MSRKKNIFQVKKQGKTPGKELNEMEIGNLYYKEFKVMDI